MNNTPTPRTDERKESFALDTIRQLETELATVTEQRDEARREAEKYRNLITNVKGWKYDLPWEKPDAVKGGADE